MKRIMLAPRWPSALLAACASRSAGTHWVTTWGASTQPDSRRTLNNVTIRNIVHLSVGGPKVRLRITNAFGGYPAAAGDAFPENTALRVGSVYVGRRSGTTARGRARHEHAGDVRRQADRADLARQRRRQRPGHLPVTDGDNLAISIYVPGTTPERELPLRRQADELHDAGQRRRPRRAGGRTPASRPTRPAGGSSTPSASRRATRSARSSRSATRSPTARTRPRTPTAAGPTTSPTG